MQSLNNKDRFGFYTVGEFKTYSKLEAIEHSGKTRTPVEWDFNKGIFSQFDWTHEPPGSLEFWYGERARQIREKYDYIVLWYSGGADSHNALMSFVHNNIFIDEIAQYHNLEGSNGNKQSFLNEEVFATSAPITQELIENNPVYRNTKHRLLDLTELQIDVLTKDDNKWDYFYKVGKYQSPNALGRSYLREVVPDYRALIDQGKSVCFIHGAEKPSVEQRNNQWYVSFSDTIDYAVSPRTQMINQEWEHDELFYWTDSLPQLIAKQAHVIRRFMCHLTPAMVDNVYVSTADPVMLGLGTTNKLIASSAEINQTNYHLLYNGLHKLIYPYWEPELLVCKKPLSLTYSARDTWMFESNSPEFGQQYYAHGLLHLRQLVRNANPDYWWELKSNPTLGIPYQGGVKPLYNQYCIS